MMTPTLTLTYPDFQSGKVRILAVTSDKRALTVFKRAVLEELKLRLMVCDDPILKVEYGSELSKAEKLLSMLIPDNESLPDDEEAAGGEDDR